MSWAEMKILEERIDKKLEHLGKLATGQVKDIGIIGSKSTLREINIPKTLIFSIDTGDDMGCLKDCSIDYGKLGTRASSKDTTYSYFWKEMTMEFVIDGVVYKYTITDSSDARMSDDRYSTIYALLFPLYTRSTILDTTYSSGTQNTRIGEIGFRGGSNSSNYSGLYYGTAENMWGVNYSTSYQYRYRLLPGEQSKSIYGGTNATPDIYFLMSFIPVTYFKTIEAYVYGTRRYTNPEGNGTDVTAKGSYCII